MLITHRVIDIDYRFEKIVLMMQHEEHSAKYGAKEQVSSPKLSWNYID